MREFYIETASMLSYVGIGIYLIDKYPEPFGIVFFLGYAVVYWLAVGPYLDRLDEWYRGLHPHPEAGGGS